MSAMFSSMARTYSAMGSTSRPDCRVRSASPATVRDHIGNKLPLAFDDLGEQQVKNIAQAIRVYRVQTETSARQPIAALPAR
jgi:hypothetical protein